MKTNWGSKFKSAGYACLLSVLAVVSTWASSCTSPDPQADFDEFAERTANERGAEESVCEGVLVDFSGTFLMSVKTPLPGDPLRLDATFDVDLDAMTMDVVLTPLNTDDTASPREPAQDPFSIPGVTLNSDGSFLIAATNFSVEADANPISDRPILAETFSIGGCSFSETELCGDVTGQIIEPIQLNLDGSSFGAVVSDDFVSVTDPPFACPGVDTGGDEPPDAGGD